MPEPRDRDRRTPPPASFVRTDWFLSEIRRIDDNQERLERDLHDHERAHDEEAKWRRRAWLTSIIAPIAVALFVAVVTAYLVAR